MFLGTRERSVHLLHLRTQNSNPLVQREPHLFSAPNHVSLPSRSPITIPSSSYQLLSGKKYQQKLQIPIWQQTISLGASEMQISTKTPPSRSRADKNMYPEKTMGSPVHVSTYMRFSIG
jgi:hypothetical protein